jgi:ParB-like chromosome segregation protein Spo0J
MNMNVHDISMGSPDMSEAEATALRDSIATIGQQVPILVWRGDVIDGRKRLSACQALGIEPNVHIVPDESDPAAFAEALNLLRTHYTPSQRAAYAEKMATATKSDGRRIREASITKFSNADVPMSQRRAAASMGVAQSAIVQARNIRRSGAPEVIQAVERGALTLHAAQQITDKVPRHEQPEVVEKVIASKKGKRNTPSQVINLAAPGLRRGPRRNITVVRGRALHAMSEHAASLDQFMEYDVAPESDVVQWREWISEITSTLKRFSKKLEAVRERTA